MGKRGREKSYCSSVDKLGCCNVESVITVDERGQMVLPKEIRAKANIRAGDKLTIISLKKGEKICCISLIKADEFAEMVKDLLGPMFKEVINKGDKK